MDTRELMELGNKVLCPTYGRFPIVLVKGEGCKVWDSDGKVYYDFVSGLAVNNLGHCHPRVVEAIRRQAGELIHVSNLYHIKPQIELARILTEQSFADRAFFCNSGAEANEAAIKLARKYAHDKFGGSKYEIITMNMSFHGRTMATISATGQEKFHKGFEPLVPGFKHVPFNDIAAVERAITAETCAVMLEPIQGEGGVNVPSEDYLPGLRRVCDEKGLLLIFDEVQTGLGRTGSLFCYQDYGVSPDIMTLAKSLAGGTAMGAMLATEEVAASFGPGTHASTFGGNPLAAAAGVAAVTSIIEENMLDNCREVGAYIMGELEGLKKKYPFIKQVRGRGLLIGMELEFEGAEIVKKCMERGFLINCTVGNVLRLLPPLVVGMEEANLVLRCLDEVLHEVQGALSHTPEKA